jgi:hypothetical protein
MIEFDYIMDFLKKRFPHTNFDVRESEISYNFIFNNNFPHKYFFELEVFKDLIEVDIMARLHDQNELSYFWHLDTFGFQSENKKLDILNFIEENLDILINSKIRIIQKKNLLNNSFTLEYLVLNSWRKLSSNYGSKRLDLPKFKGRVKTYD